MSSLRQFQLRHRDLVGKSSSGILALTVAVGVLLSTALAGGEEPSVDTSPHSSAPLLLIKPGKGFDGDQWDKQISIVGHYYDGIGAKRELCVVAIAKTADWRDVVADEAVVKVLDEDSRSNRYLWVSASSLTNERLAGSGGRILATRSGGASALVVVGREEEKASEVVDWVRKLSPSAARVSVVDLDDSIPLEWILAASRESTASALSAIPQRAMPNPEIAALINGVDAGACDLLVRQMTGEIPVRTDDGEVTIRSRHAVHPDTAVLTCWLREDLEKSGCDATLDTFSSPVHPSHGPLTQVVATIPGTDLASELVLLTAHLDAVRNSAGANDNASGTAAIVTAAKRLATERGRFRRTIQIVAFNDEEQGLVGSADYARRLRDAGATVVAVINLDMVAFDRDGDRRLQLQSNGTLAANALNERLVMTAETYGINVKLVRIVDPEESSDYASFWRVGYSAINIGDEYFLCDEDCVEPPRRGVAPPEGDFTPCYHLPCDRRDATGYDASLIVDATKLVVGSVAEIAELRPRDE